MIKNKVPGAGTYAPVLEMNKMGKYVLSNVPNSGAQNWSPSKQRFVDRDRHLKRQPGPGAYDPSDVDSSKGSYITSNFKNTANNVRIVPPNKFVG